MRRLLGVLGPDGTAAPLTPAAGISAVGELVDGVRRAGLPVEFETAGTPADLPEGLDVALYRVAQEALTNALRYCGGAPTRLTVRYGPDTVEVEVEDDGPRRPGPPPSSGGRGLLGMHERVALYGGSLTAAPRQEGGFRVHACIPVAESRP
jgi:signal transduction histidine kinase